MINKPFDQITIGDINGLCSYGGSYESQMLEFKRELPNKSGRPDPWIAGGDFSSFARDELFREIVAFANAQGGLLLLGIAETKDRPPRAASIAPVPRVHELASRLEQAAQACIEPPLGGLHVRGIATAAENDGVILFRTGASPFGPHRVRGDGHAYIRRGPHTVQMTMREIQDLTLDLARGADRLNNVFAQRAADFTVWFARTLSEAGGLRITASPIAPLPQSIRVVDQPGGTVFVPAFRGVMRVGGREHEHVCVLPIQDHHVRPILRGHRRYSDSEGFAFQLDVLNNGIIDFWLRHAVEQGIHLRTKWILAGYVAVLRSADFMRKLTGAADWDFAVEVMLDGICRSSSVVVPIESRRLPAIELGALASGRWTIGLPFLPPRTSSRSRADDDDLLNALLRDLLDAAGIAQPFPRVTLLP
jgi:hypothetical protein